MTKQIRKFRAKGYLAIVAFSLFLIIIYGWHYGYLFRNNSFAKSSFVSESLKGRSPQVYTNSINFSSIITHDIFTSVYVRSKFSSKAQDYIRRTEKVRERFAKKRMTNLIGSRNLDEIGLFEAKDKATTVWNFFPPTFTCPHIMERVGCPGDGGKWMCGLELFEKEHLKNECIVYSFGVARDSSFEMELLERTNCKIYAFDPTVNGLNFDTLSPTLKEEARLRTHFFKIGLGAYNDPTKKMFTLGQIMANNGHSWIDFLKVDIEGSEFESFRQISSEFNDTFPFGHLNIEIHLKTTTATSPIWSDIRKWIGLQQDKGILKEFYEFWNMLELKALRAFAWEDNHYPCINGEKPNLIEYAFININDERNRLLWW